jgi:hypothetical protein
MQLRSEFLIADCRLPIFGSATHLTEKRPTPIEFHKSALKNHQSAINANLEEKN